MPTAIAVTSPDLVLPPPDHHTPLAAVLQPPAAQSLEGSLAEMHTLLEQHGYVVVVYPNSLAPGAVHRLHTVRSVLESDRIALLPMELPPLAVAVLVRQLRQLSLCDFSPGVIASAARLLSHYIYAGALLASVTKLDRVPVTLKAHAKSWVPGSQFAVLTAPTPHLLKLTSHPTDALPGPGFGTHMLVARGQLQSEWVGETLAPSWHVQGLLETALPADSAGWWGTPKLIEFASAISDISVLYQLVASVRRETCHWCGLQLIGDRCGFCSSPLLQQSAPTPPPAQRPTNQKRVAGALTTGST
ncbi:hypothetical protein [Streptomyces sp. NBC_01465]|uniref:hypothetical protein n=1 Tax=Streptomyces sp. NBC_01465 TaxID=2903878 RepID=UPI002E37E78F|nr:hypothetical protein [Streptomyces sp. NBC_01465]